MPKLGFKGGIHPTDHKAATNSVQAVRMPLPERLFVPVSQHLGAPCQPLVSRGDRVERGQIIADVDAMVSAPIHSPVTGEVISVVARRLVSGSTSLVVEILPDEHQDWDSWVLVPESDDAIAMVRAAGIVGLGGAAFPTTVKLTPPRDMPVHTLILNGCECEPFLTCDHRVMLESPDRVVAGARIIADIVGAERIVIGVEDNKLDAADALRVHAGTDVEILVLPTSYPQGAEKQLIYAVLGKEVPHGKLPAATGALVQNVGTAMAVADAVQLRKPLMERIVTVGGSVVAPSNLIVCLGTPLRDLVAAAGGFGPDVGRVIAGGPMTGTGVADLGMPVVKGTSGLIALTSDQTAPCVNGDQACIRCGKCSDACPMFLQPFAIGIYANIASWDGAERFHALDCIECGSCSFVCPSHRPLVQLIRLAKHRLMERGARL